MNRAGKFGRFGGCYAPETVMAALAELQDPGNSCVTTRDSGSAIVAEIDEGRDPGPLVRRLLSACS